jgi:hypothetical protein
VPMPYGRIAPPPTVDRHAFRPMASSDVGGPARQSLQLHSGPPCGPNFAACSVSWRGLDVHAILRPTGLAWQRCQPGRLPPPVCFLSFLLLEFQFSTSDPKIVLLLSLVMEFASFKLSEKLSLPRTR